MYMAIMQIVHGGKFMVASSSGKTFAITWFIQFVEKFMLHAHIQVNKLTVLMCTLYRDSLHVLAITLAVAIQRFHV